MDNSSYYDQNPRGEGSSKHPYTPKARATPQLGIETDVEPTQSRTPISPEVDHHASSSQYSQGTTPSNDPNGLGIHRRRLSNPPSPGPLLGRTRRKSTHESQRLPPPPNIRHRLPEDGHSYSWNLLSLPVDVKKSRKSDDEREEESDRELKKHTKPKKRRNWWGMGHLGQQSNRGQDVPPAISMTPPANNPMVLDFPPLVPSNLSPPRNQPYSGATVLAPLQQDPYNILPLSVPSTPLPSPPPSIHPTPQHSPHPSIGDLAAEFLAHSNSAGPSGSSGSPRTSISTSSSRLGWQNGASRSDSRSSVDDDESPTFPSYKPLAHSKTWWRRDGVPVSPQISTAPTSRRPLRSRLVPSGTSPWRRVLEYFGATEDRRKVRTSRQKLRNRAVSGSARKGRNQPVLGSKWLGRAMAFVPTTPWSIFFSFTFTGFLVFMIIMTVKHVLNPDKEPLPYRAYCSADHPTMYSLQDPTLDAASVGTRSSNLVLAPLTPSDLTWQAPYSADLQSIDDLDPVGVLVGVFTTDNRLRRRQMIRQSYASHWRSRREGTEGVRVRFVMGRPRAKFARAVQLEMEAFNDIIFLDMPENMNSGKTHAFFSWAAENATVPHWEYPTDDAPVYKGERAPAYVVKADEDSFIMLGELERRLRVAPRSKAYWGYLVKNLFMAGECYALSFDLVQYIASSPALRTFTRGKEDKLVSKWMRMHPERENITWVTDRCWIYDHPKAGTVYSHGFLYPSTVAEIRAEQSRPDTYSTVTKFGSRHHPLSRDMSAVESVEALIEGSSLSLLRDVTSTEKHDHIPPEIISRLYQNRPTRRDRFLGDEKERGGTVVVHYLKRQDWFIETMIALLGSADEQGVEHVGVGTGLGMLERREGRGMGGELPVIVGKEVGL